MRKLTQLFIDGQWCQSSSTARLTLTNPSNGEVCLQICNATAEDAEKAIQAARGAFSSWSNSTAIARAELMRTAADIMQRRYDELVEAHVLTLGCPVSIAGELQVDAAIAAMRYYADLADRMEQVDETNNLLIVREAVGVCVLINPWNYPLHQLIGKLAPALAAGCTVVAKPAEQTPLQDMIMAEVLAEAGLPAGVFNLLTGDGKALGPVLCSHPEVDMVSFTGSTAAGVEVASAAAPSIKRVCQELGGKSAYIITEDADLSAAVRYGVEDVMLNSGQTCNALTRLLIPASHQREAIALAIHIASEQKLGDPTNSNVTMGPLVSRLQQQRVQRYIHAGLEQGAELVLGGPDCPAGLEQGCYVHPTIFANVSNDMLIAREEIFGPVLCIMPYDTLEDAIAIANDSPYGLSSAVYAKDQQAALAIARQLRAGQCYLQGAYFSLQAPFGGYKQSGNGREWGEQGLEEYIETKAIICG